MHVSFAASLYVIHDFVSQAEVQLNGIQLAPDLNFSFTISDHQ